MTEKSLICTLMETDPEWEQKIYEKNISIRRSNGYVIFNYGPGCDWADPVVREARGIIIDPKTCEVVCWPFSKFFNAEQTDFAAEIDWKTARVQEKIDGSIVKLWYDENKDWQAKNCWRWSTNSVIDANDAPVQGFGSFQQLIDSTPESGIIKKQLSTLDPDYTYIFELVSPENRIVIRHDETRLWHIGTRNNRTGEEIHVNLGIQKPKEYKLLSLEACMNAVKILNAGADIPDHEGFVVVDGHWNRIKVKSPEYVFLHATLENRAFGKDRILKMLLAGEDIEYFCKNFPEFEVFFRYYQYKLAEIRYKGNQMRNKALALYEEYDHDIKAVAEQVKDDPYAAFAFQAIRKGMTAEETIQKMSLPAVARLVPEYAG